MRIHGNSPQLPHWHGKRATLVRTMKIVERQAVQWVDGPKKIGRDDTGSDDRGMKSARDGTLVERGTPQLNVQELGQEPQLTLHEHETQGGAFRTRRGDAGGVLETREGHAGGVIGT